MKSSFSAAGCEEVTNHLTTHCFMQCGVYTFSLHSIHSTVGHMEKEPESKTRAGIVNGGTEMRRQQVYYQPHPHI